MKRLGVIVAYNRPEPPADHPDAALRSRVLEVNANPDIGPAAGFARSRRVAGIEYDAFINRLVNHTYDTRRRTAAHA